MAIDYDRLMHWPFAPVEQTYTEKDTMLYALGVGVGADPLDEGQLRFVFEEPGLVALPTMAAVLGTSGFWLRDPATGVDWKKVLHGEQGIELHRPLPAAATVVAQTRVTDIIDKGVLPPEKVRGYGTVIGAEARKLGKLIEGMLEFERIDSGGRSYIVETIDLRDPVREAIGEFATQLKETGFRTEVRLPASPVPFVGNLEALSHAFGNIVGNAIKYSEDHRFLRVELMAEDGNAVIKVHDHGAGIPASERSRIFQRFYRVRRDPETDPTGTGLGLPIAQHVVRSHGGTISVESSSARGSVFRIELPLARTQDNDPPDAVR